MKTFLDTLKEVFLTCMYLVVWAVTMLYLAMSLTDDGGILHYYGILAVIMSTTALVIHIKKKTKPFKNKKP